MHDKSRLGHDLNGRLVTVEGCLMLLAEHGALASDAEARELVETARQNAREVRELIARLLRDVDV